MIGLPLGRHWNELSFLATSLGHVVRVLQIGLIVLVVVEPLVGFTEFGLTETSNAFKTLLRLARYHALRVLEPLVSL